MPTVFKWRGYRFFFYANERQEPAHVHVRKGGCEAKIWLHDCSVAFNLGYSSRELSEIVRSVRAERQQLRKAWDDFLGNRR